MNLVAFLTSFPLVCRGGGVGETAKSNLGRIEFDRPWSEHWVRALEYFTGIRDTTFVYSSEGSKGGREERGQGNEMVYGMVHGLSLHCGFGDEAEVEAGGLQDTYRTLHIFLMIPLPLILNTQAAVVFAKGNRSIQGQGQGQGQGHRIRGLYRDT